MKSLLLTGAISSIFYIQMTGVVFAGAADGVKCPNGTSTSFSNGKLTCYKTKTYTRGSMCPPINRPLNIIMQSKGRDRCLAAVSGNAVSSAMTPGLPGHPSDRRFTRRVSQNGVDSFVASVTKYKHPRGKIYTHNAKRGVSCPSGYSARFRNNRLKCKKTISKRSSCDIPWRLRPRGNGKKDQCYIKTPFGETIGNYTVPQGVSGIGGHPSRRGWRLRVDKRGNRDYWEKTKYAYPKGN